MFNSILKALQTVSEVPLYPDDSMMSSICHTVNSHTVKKTKKEKKKSPDVLCNPGFVFPKPF